MGEAYNMPEYGRSYIHWKNEQDLYQNMKDRISMGEAYNMARIWKIVYPLEKMNKDYTRI